MPHKVIVLQGHKRPLLSRILSDGAARWLLVGGARNHAGRRDSPIGSTLPGYVESPAGDFRMPEGTTVASALDFRSRSFSRSLERRNVRLPSSNEQILRAAVRLPEQETGLSLLGILD
jgi:hypothetical protein